jgi:hypothetical protein
MNTLGLSGTLQNTTPLVILLADTTNNSSPPYSISLNSTAGGRLIELSVDGGLNFFAPVLDSTTTNQIAVVINAPFTHARITGVAGNLWRIL